MSPMAVSTAQRASDAIPVPSWFVDPVSGNCVAANRLCLDWLGLDEIPTREDYARRLTPEFSKQFAAFIGGRNPDETFKSQMIWTNPDGEVATAWVAAWWLDGLIQGQTITTLKPKREGQKRLLIAVVWAVVIIGVWEAVQWIQAIF